MAEEKENKDELSRLKNMLNAIHRELIDTESNDDSDASSNDDSGNSDDADGSSNDDADAPSNDDSGNSDDTSVDEKFVSIIDQIRVLKGENKVIWGKYKAVVSTNKECLDDIQESRKECKKLSNELEMLQLVVKMKLTDTNENEALEKIDYIIKQLSE